MTNGTGPRLKRLSKPWVPSRPLRSVSVLCGASGIGGASEERIPRRSASFRKLHNGNRALIQFWNRFNNRLRFILCFALLVAVAAAEETLQLDPSQSTLKFTLEASLHTVHGSFQLRQGALQFDPASGKVSGDIRADAKSGQSGNGMRDRKMHREILDSEQHPEIVFRPDRVEGSVAAQGKSSVKVHGIFSLRGTEHEIVVPTDVEITGDRWSATARLTIPYVKWGVKNPSTLFLRVSDSVEIDLVAAGSVTRRTATSTH